MNIKNKCLLVILFVCISSVYAQKSKDTLIENGKIFLVHTVEKGQTLYGLSKIYNVSIEQIIKYNPQAENGVKAKESINIYVGEETKTVFKEPKVKTVTDDSLPKQIHSVEAGETLFGIARKYGVTLVQLHEWNPGLTENLSIGQKITVYSKSVSQQKENIPSKQVSNKGNKKASYKVYALIPLYLHNLDRIDTTNFKDLSDYDAIKSFHFIQFYEGLLLAAEDASKKGIPIKLYVEDINEQNTNKLKEMIQQGKFADADLIIGPFFSDEFAMMCEYAKNKNIPLVNPFSVTFDECNSTMFKVSASYQSQAEQIGKYIAQKNDKAQIILVNNQSTGDIAKILAYKAGLIRSIPDSKQISIKEINYAKEGVSGIQNAMNPDCENYVFTFFTGEINITNFIQRMYALKYENVTLFAPSFWNEYDNIETEYFMSLKTHYVDPFFVDYSDPAIITFIDKFREKYETEPTLEKFAYQGYDITYYFLTALMEYGCNFGTEINDIQLPLLSTQFHFKQISGHCFENTFIHIYKLKDYKLIDAIKDMDAEQTTPTVNPK